MDYPERLAHAMQLAELPEYGGTSQLARAIDTSPQAIAQVLKGISRSLSAENTAYAARFLKVDGFWLATGEGEPRPYVDEAGIMLAKRFMALSPGRQEMLLERLRELERRR